LLHARRIRAIVALLLLSCCALVARAAVAMFWVFERVGAFF